MKTMKKLFALVLAVMLIGAIALPAAAEGGTTYTITVQGTATGHIFEAYQIFSGKLSENGVLTGVEWGSGVDTSQEEALLDALQDLPRYEKATDAASVAKALDNATTADGLEFAAIVGKYLSKVKVSSAGQSGPTYKLEGLATGYYLIKDKDDSLDGLKDESYTEFIMSLSKNTTVNPKSGQPNIYKKVSETGVSGSYDSWVTQSIGSKVHFDIRGTISNELHYYDEYYYAFHDTMSQGLTFDSTSVKVIRVDADGGTNEIDRDCYTVSAVPDGNNTKLTVVFDDLLDATSGGVGLTINRSDAISLQYAATLNGNTKIGIANPDTNTVYLEYSNNPNTDDHGITHDADVDVYTFGLEILKVDAMNGDKKLAGAKFILYRTISGVTTYAKANQENGTYKISQWVAAEAEATPFETNSDGRLLVSGVKAGGFYVKEITPPSGYNALEEPLEVWIQVKGENLNKGESTDDVTASIDGALVSVNPANGIISATIENASGTVLPSTGGIGTTIFYVAGGILVVGALILLVTRKRMDAEV